MALRTLKAEITGCVWKIETRSGQAVPAGAVLLVMESMKMEIPLAAPVAGVVKEICVSEGDMAAEGDTLVVMETES